LPIRTFLLTLSPKQDISPECVAWFTKYITKNCLYYYAVTEMASKLHLHAVLVYKELRSKSDLHDRFVRELKKFHPDAYGKAAVHLITCPGHKWYDTYLQKSADTIVLADKYPREDVTPFFPTSEEQDQLIESAKTKKGTCNAWWDKHVCAWESSAFPNSPVGAGFYLQNAMDNNEMNVIKDDRTMADTAYALYRRRNRILELNQNVLRLLEQKTAHLDFEYKPQTDGAPGDSQKLWKDKVFTEDDPYISPDRT